MVSYPTIICTSRPVLMLLELHCSELFASIYEPLCRDAWIKAAKGQLRKSFLDAVASKMRHSDSLLQEEAILGLQRIKATSLCSMCPWDMQPEVFFDCGHGICARDAWHYSQIRLYESDHSTLAQFKACPVCSKPSSLRVRLRPLQAGYRLGAFDGGGTYAINELILLQYIIQPMPAGLEAHHYFDHVTATSAGKYRCSMIPRDRGELTLMLNQVHLSLARFL